MAYTPPDRHALDLDLGGGYTPPDRHALVFELPPPAAGDEGLVSGQARQSALAFGGDIQLVIILAGQAGQRLDAAGSNALQGALAAGQSGQSLAAEAAISFHRVVASQSALPWQRGEAQHAQIASRFGDGAHADGEVRVPGSPGSPVDGTTGIAWGAGTAADAHGAIRLSPGEPVEHDLGSPWRNPAPQDIQRASPWSRPAPLDLLQARLPWRNPPWHDIERGLPWGVAEPLAVERLLPAFDGAIADLQRRLPWGDGDGVPWVWQPAPPPHPPPPQPPPCYTPPDRHAAVLDIGQRGTLYVPPHRHALQLDLRCDRGRRFDVRRTLHVSHSLSVVRLPDRLPLAVRSVSMSTDRDAWCWAVSLAFADASSALAVEPTPDGYQSVEITLDGYVWTAAIEGYTEDRSHNRRTIGASGRSRTAALAAPHHAERAYDNPTPATAQQLALRELDFTGVALDWQLGMDWTVPAGAWAYSAETPVSAIAKIAAAAGGMMQSARDSDTLIVAPRLPAAPWALGAEQPDFTLAGGSWLRKGRRYGSGAGYKGAVVTGQNQGVTVIVYRDGTSGSPYAPQVVDPLITDTAPGIARGTAIVADSLPRHEIPIELPLIPAPLAPGLLLPGELGEIEDTVWGLYRAVVDGVQISAEVDARGLVTARQSATLWRYLV